jgi:hypothetical protein
VLGHWNRAATKASPFQRPPAISWSSGRASQHLAIARSETEKRLVDERLLPVVISVHDEFSCDAVALKRHPWAESGS